jgi:quinol monooxygenase YgiN
MTYIRLSIARARKGEDQRLEELMRKLTDLAAEQEGCTASYLLRPHDDSGEVARITIYTNEAAAEQAANNQSVMAIRSEIHLISESGHEERAFFSL